MLHTLIKKNSNRCGFASIIDKTVKMIGENEESFIIEKHFVNKFKFGELRKSEFTEENSNGTVPTDYIYSDFNISNNIICDIHSQENKKALADIVFGRTSSAAYIHRTDDLL